MHPVLGEIDDVGPLASRDDLPHTIEEVTIEVLRVPEPPSVRRIIRRVVVAALKRMADKLENG